MAEDLVARVHDLRRQVRTLKGAIAANRRTLRAVATELAVREAECRRFGIPIDSATPRVGDRLHGDQS